MVIKHNIIKDYMKLIGQTYQIDCEKQLFKTQRQALFTG